MSSFNIKLINFYPPFIGAGIRLDSVNEDRTKMLVSMKLRWYNRNIWNVHFGGSLYAMCDPWFMFIVQHHLGKDYVVWDKAANIVFKKPGKGKVQACFELSKKTLDIVKAHVDAGKSREFNFQAQVIDESGDTVAEVTKTVYANTKTAHKKRLAERRKQRLETKESDP